MPRNNYAQMAAQIRRLFLTYDQAQIAAKIPLTLDESFFYLPVLDRLCRIHRVTGDLSWQEGTRITSSTDPTNAITIFDYLCDARPDRTLTGEFQGLTGFGHLFHTGLVENRPVTPLETFIDHHPHAFCQASLALGGTPYPRGDLGYQLPLFPDFPVVLQFYHSDEDFPPQLRSFWDGNSLSFLRYETMHYALRLIEARLEAKMGLVP